METIDIYNNNIQKTGKIANRKSRLLDGEYRLIVHLVIFDDNRMLIQKRSENVNSFKGKWDISSGGGVVANEDAINAIKRETKEELGIEIDNIKPLITFYCEHEIDIIYYINYQLSDFKKTKDVSEIKYATKEEIINLIDNDEFVKYKKEIIETIFSFQIDFNEYNDKAWENE